MRTLEKPRWNGYARTIAGQIDIQYIMHTHYKSFTLPANAPSERHVVQAGGSASKGSSAGTHSGAKCRMLRDRIVSPRLFAVAAMMTSANPGA